LKAPGFSTVSFDHSIPCSHHLRVLYLPQAQRLFFEVLSFIVHTAKSVHQRLFPLRTVADCVWYIGPKSLHVGYLVSGAMTAQHSCLFLVRKDQSQTSILIPRIIHISRTSRKPCCCC